MKIWLSKSSGIPIREQITTQIILGVASGDLRGGEKLPATRQIARRCGVHANTVAAAYRELAAQGWLEFRKGSGFYVRSAENRNVENSLDRLIVEFYQKARSEGFSAAEIKDKLMSFFARRTPDKILLIESDTDFRAILAEEIRQATGLEIAETSFEDFQKNDQNGEYVFAAMFDEKPKLEPLLPPDGRCVFLKARSVAGSMTGRKRPSAEDLIAVVSGWEKFLLMAKTMLVAAQIDAESLIVRHTREADWQNGLQQASMIICDALTAARFPAPDNLLPFRLIADESLERLRQIDF
jgi:DNA-binding transcriptional regulator YhcF (GntR family)